MSGIEKTKKEQENRAKLVCLLIGIFGILLLIPFNWNVNLVRSGNKVTAKVIEINQRWNGEKGVVIEIEYLRNEIESVTRKVEDYTGENFLLFIEKGDSLSVYESKDEPYTVYLPFLHFIPKLSIEVV